MASPTLFAPHRLLRNGHVQSVLASTRLRLLRHRRTGLELERRAEERVVDAGDGARLLALHSPADGNADLAVLVHGWLGCAASTYMLSTGERLLRAGLGVVRLNLRDHGDTHALNRETFHANRIDEVVGAVRALGAAIPHRRLFVVGFSLGGSFALRLALRAPGAGIALAHVVAVNPALVPARVLAAIDAWTIYRRHFAKQWKRSLVRKARAFPGAFDFSGALAARSVRAISEAVIPPYTPHATLDEYFAGYTIGAGPGVAWDLRALSSPTTIVTAADDPLIDVADFRRLPSIPHLSVDVQARGGHCGYVEGFGLGSWIESRILTALG